MDSLTCDKSMRNIGNFYFNIFGVTPRSSDAMSQLLELSVGCQNWKRFEKRWPTIQSDFDVIFPLIIVMLCKLPALCKIRNTITTQFK